MPTRPGPPSPLTVVVLDTNEVQRDWLLQGLAMKVLAFMSWHVYLKVVVPAVVLEELVANYERQREEADVALRRLNKERKRNGLPLAQAAGEPVDYRAFFETFLDEEVSGWEMADWPALEHRDAAIRSLSRQPPFDHTDRGYRDLLIWETARAYAALGHDVYLASRDGDFAEGRGNGLAHNLASQIENLAGSVALVDDMSAWLVDRFPSKAVDLKEAVDIARDIDLEDFLSQSDFLDTQFPEVDELGLPEGVSQVEVGILNWLGPLTRVHVRTAKDGAVLAHYDLPVEVDVEATMTLDEAKRNGWRVIAEHWHQEPAPSPSEQLVRAEQVVSAAARLVVFGSGPYVEEVRFRPYAHQDPSQASLFDVW